jgi:hypothetical protein
MRMQSLVFVRRCSSCEKMLISRSLAKLFACSLSAKKYAPLTERYFVLAGGLELEPRDTKPGLIDSTTF